MTGLHNNLTKAIAAAALMSLFVAGCPQGEAPAPAVDAPELPPPLSELGTTATPSTVPEVDPTDWRLPDEGSEPAHPPWLRLFYSQDNRGELEACGCPGAPTGGMARRATLVPQLRAVLPDALIVEGPSALSRAILGFETVDGEHRRRGRLVLELIAGTAPTAFFPGQADFAVIEPPELGRLASSAGMPLVATNLAQDVAGFQRYLVHPVDDRRVLFLGLIRAAATEERMGQAPVTDAVEAASRALTEASQAHGRIDLVVAFTDGDLRDLSRLREGGLDVDVLLAPPEPTAPPTWSFEDERLVVRSDPLGRAFRRLDVVFDAEREGRGLRPRSSIPWQVERVAAFEEQYLVQGRWLRDLEARIAAGEDPKEVSVGFDGVERLDPRTDVEAVRAALAEVKAQLHQSLAAAGALRGGHSVGFSTLVLEPSVLEDIEVQDRLDEVGRRRLSELELSLPAPDQVPRAELYAGKDGCIGCHAEQHAHWSLTAHAGAWRTLVERGENENPNCLGCHTTGFGEPGGFADPTTDRALLNVQCEACHGPMALHAEQHAGRLGFKPDPGLAVTERTCLRCHDPANSPKFAFETFYPKVVHPGLRP